MVKQKRHEDIERVEEVCGPNVARKLIDEFGGMRLYIPCRRHVEQQNKYLYIVQKFNGSNHRELAEATGYSVRRVYEILKRA